MDSNHRPKGYEPSELPLLYLAIYLNDYNPTFPTVTYPRHALVEPAGVINIFLRTNTSDKKSHKLLKFLNFLTCGTGCFTKVINNFDTVKFL